MRLARHPPEHAHSLPICLFEKDLDRAVVGRDVHVAGVGTGKTQSLGDSLGSKVADVLIEALLEPRLRTTGQDSPASVDASDRQGAAVGQGEVVGGCNCSAHGWPFLEGAGTVVLV